MSTRDLRPFGLSPDSFVTAAPARRPAHSGDGLGRLVRRLLAAQFAASLGLGACVAYAYSPPKPQPFGEKLAFSLRLTTFAD